MKRVVFVTSHYWNCECKAGFHWLADAFWRAGWHVTFFTESISWLSWLRRDPRFDFPIFKEANRLQIVRERQASFVWLTPFHPVNLRNRWLNRLAKPVLSLYSSFPLGEAESEVKKADLFIFDSDHGLFLFDRFKACNPHARFIYRVSDHIPMMRHHPMVLLYEERIAGRFDLLSVPCDYIQKRFAHLPHVLLQYHGLRKEMFDAPCANPYRGKGPFLVYVGMHYFDHDFLTRAVRLLPEGTFHVFGRIAHLPAAANLVAYGEKPFAEIVPYLKYANVGLQSLTYRPGAECFTDSLKMHQYTYCRLPVVAPTFLKQSRPHVFYYVPQDDESIRAALNDALKYDRTQISTEAVVSWDNIAARWAA